MNGTPTTDNPIGQKDKMVAKRGSSSWGASGPLVLHSGPACSYFSKEAQPSVSQFRIRDLDFRCNEEHIIYFVCSSLLVFLYILVKLFL